MQQEKKLDILKKHYREYYKDSFPPERLDKVVDQALCLKEETGAIMKAMDEWADTQHSCTSIWVNDRLPEIVDKKCTPRYVRVERKNHEGKTFIAKAVAYYFPDHFKTVEWEDWGDYNEEDFPYTESDEEREVVWLRAGWYEDIECDTCDNSHWSAPVKVVEWMDESPSKEGNKEREVNPLAFHKWMIETGWKEHSSGRYYYRSKDSHQWPPDETCEESELLDKYNQQKEGMKCQ